MFGGKGEDYFNIDYSMLGGKKRSLQKIMDFEPGVDVLWVINSSPEHELTINGNKLSINGMDAAQLKGLSASEIEIAVDTAQFV